MKVLVVDDSLTYRKLLRLILEAEQFTTIEAIDGVEALAALEREKVDAIISDILMPNMDGYRLCQEVRRDERLRDTPLILHTSTYLSPADEKLAIDCGADRYFVKPAPPDLITATIRELTAPSRPQPSS